MSMTDLLLAARDGDEDAYRRLVQPLRGELQAHCYRMLGSLHDAEDALQDALLRAWRGLARFEGRGSFRGWLYTIATNACLALIARRPKRVLPIGLDPETVPPAERVWLDPYPDAGLPDGRLAPEARYEQRESVELAFVAALQHLPATQRAVLVLRDVLGFSARETAESLDSSVAAVNSALQRARATVEAGLPAQSQQVALRSLGDTAVRDLVVRYTDAWQAGDVSAIVALLAEDAKFAMPPYAEWYDGIEEITAALLAGPLTRQWRFLPVGANGQVAFGTYEWDEVSRRYLAGAIDVVSVRGDAVVEITAFIDRGIFAAFGLPDSLPE